LKQYSSPAQDQIMAREFTPTDAKAQACSYLLLNLLQRLDQKEPGLIDELITGVKGDFQASSLQSDLPPPVSLIYQEAIAILERANAYKLGI
jgi:hypothetical protein